MTLFSLRIKKQDHGTAENSAGLTLRGPYANTKWGALLTPNLPPFLLLPSPFPLPPLRSRPP